MINQIETELPLTPRVIAALKNADHAAKERGEDSVYTTHLLVSLIEDIELYSANAVIDAVGHKGWKAICEEANRVSDSFKVKKEKKHGKD